MNYTIACGETRHAEHPDTFWIPDAQARQNLKAGDTVKLMFELKEPKAFEVNSERMWVQVTERHEDGTYSGKLDNDPIVIGANAGDTIKFEARHVINIYE